MPFNGAGSSLSGANDVFLSNPADSQLLGYDAATAKWKNKVTPSASVNVLAYGAVVGGTVDCTTAIRNAIADAIAKRAELYWPAGTYKVTGNLYNFWKIDHVGPGAIIQRGSNSHILQPSRDPATLAIETAILYANGTTGVDSDNNDGLFPESAVKSLAWLDQRMIDRIGLRGLQGEWKIRLSGTFGQGRWFTYRTKFARPLIFEGDPLDTATLDDFGHGYPVTTIQYDGGPAIMGMWFEEAKNVVIRNLKATGFSVSFNGYGFGVKSNCQMTAEDCQVVDSDCGFASINSSVAIFKYCKVSRTAAVTSTTTGFRNSYSATITTNHCIVTGLEYGVSATRNSVGHVDYTILQDCTIAGLKIDMAARINAMSSQFKRNAVGVHTDGAAEWVDENCLFYMGTADANTVTYEARGVSREARMHSDRSINEFITYSTTSTIATSAGVNTNLILPGSAYALPAYWFEGSPKRLRCRVSGTLSGADLKSITMIKTDSSAGRAGIIGSVSTAASGAFVLEFDLYALTRASQRSLQVLQIHGVATSVLKSDKALATDHDWWFRIQANSGSTASTVTIDLMEMYWAG